MGDIYRTATTVLACIGPHDENSRIVADLPHDVGISLDNASDEKISLDDGEWWEDWIMSKDKHFLTRMCRAIYEFGERPYWYRLWIVQELFEARKVEVLCGESRLDYWVVGQVVGIYLHTSIVIPNRDEIHWEVPYYGMSAFETVATAVLIAPAPVTSGLTDVWRLHCEDPRDRIYGMLRLFEWFPPEAKPVPDYARPAVDLAMAVLDSVQRFAQASTLLWALKMNWRDCSLRRLEQQRREGLLPSRHPGFQRLTMNVDICYAARIAQDEHGILTVRRDSRLSDDMLASGEAFIPEKALHSVSPSRQPIPLVAAGYKAFFVPSNVQVGDILVEDEGLSLEKVDGCLMVLRQRSETVYEFVGPASIAQGYHTRFFTHCECFPNADGTAVNGPTLQISISKLDLVLLLARRECEEDHLEYLSYDWPCKGSLLEQHEGRGRLLPSLPHFVDEHIPP
ncbi:hypothetical protein LTR56_021745 [Elasticomyces elasticus]|nr:hypothetical protein LTR56_021745 [Elasticomyces elasticus]KAK3630697.1 hypothetical protein LTR22_021392 [Elasticomyces elasticus]KAK4909117.1 hypothetical protein LTR49_022088 [Elasticomyces elasticus]KAK5749256.1 hypothetical protein LTS12_020698 [Elasticomyces elasticus]